MLGSQGKTSLDSQSQIIKSLNVIVDVLYEVVESKNCQSELTGRYSFRCVNE